MWGYIHKLKRHKRTLLSQQLKRTCLLKTVVPLGFHTFTQSVSAGGPDGKTTQAYEGPLGYTETQQHEGGKMSQL